MESMHRNRALHHELLVLLLTVVSVLATGCGAGTALQPSVLRNIKSTRVISHVPQEAPAITPREFQPGVAEVFAIGFVGSAAVNSISNALDEAWWSPKVEQFKGFDLRGQLWRSISPVFRDMIWLKATEPECSPWPESPATEQMVANSAVLALSTFYGVFPNGQVFVVETTARFYEQGHHESEAAIGRMTYYSSPIGSQEKDEAIAQWLAGDGVQYRKMLDEAAAETGTMLHHVLRHMAGDSPPAAQPEAYLPIRLANGKKLEIHGDIIRFSTDRVIFRKDNGEFLSLAKEGLAFGP